VAGDDAQDDVVARPRYADWENEGTGDDAIYLSWHSNAANGVAQGTVSFVYNNDPNPPYDQWARTTGSLELQSAVHDKLISAIRSGWDSAWYDFGKRQANLGEVREVRSMPSVLVETAFHDNMTDAAALREPRFAQLLARAVYQGIVDYFASKDGVLPRYLPEPPPGLVMRNTGRGAVTVAWRPPATFALGTSTHPAERYRVYLSDDGFAWDNGRDVAGTSLVLTGLVPGRVVFARVTAVNAGGESLPSPVLAVRVGDSPRVLVVHGFDSLDATMRINQGAVTRMRLDRMNRLNYIVQHAEAVTESFDSAVRLAIESGVVAPGHYQLVDWYSGSQTAEDGVLSEAERVALRAFVAAPRRVLVISGANVAAALHSSDPNFLAGVLGAGLSTDSVGLYMACGAGVFGGLRFDLDDGSGPAYDAWSSDALSAEQGSAIVMAYEPHAVAGIEKRLAAGSIALLLGFPLEAANPPSARRELMRRALAWLDDQPEPQWRHAHTLFFPVLGVEGDYLDMSGCMR